MIKAENIGDSIKVSFLGSEEDIDLEIEALIDTLQDYLKGVIGNDF